MYPLYALPSMLSSGFTSDFRFMSITILYLLTSYFTTCILFHQSPALILSYHEYSLLDIACYIFARFCMLVLTTRFSMYGYDSVLSIRVCLSLHTIWHSYHHSLGSSSSPGSSCPGPGPWNVWILPVADWLVSKTAYFIPHLHIYLILNSVNNTSLVCF